MSRGLGEAWVVGVEPTPVSWPGEFHELDSPGVAKSWTPLSDFHFLFL